MKKSLSTLVRPLLLALLLGLAHANARAQSPAPSPSASGTVASKDHPGAEIRQKYALLVETWKANHQAFVRDHPDEFRDQVKNVLLSYVQNPRDVRVEIAPTTQPQLQRAFFPHIVFEFRDGDFDTGRVRHLLVDMRDVQLSFEDVLLWDRIRFVNQGKIEYICEIAEEDLNSAIFKSAESQKKKSNFRNAHIELRNGSMRLSGRVSHALGSTNVRVDGTMKVVEGNKINFLPTALKLSILPLPGFVAREIFSRINPIADLARLKFDATPDLILSRQNRLYVLTKGMQAQIGKESP